MSPLRGEWEAASRGVSLRLVARGDERGAVRRLRWYGPPKERVSPPAAAKKASDPRIFASVELARLRPRARRRPGELVPLYLPFLPEDRAVCLRGRAKPGRGPAPGGPDALGRCSQKRHNHCGLCHKLVQVG